MLEPLAIQIYRRYLRGETLEQLAAELGIPRDRIEMRLRAAAEYLARQTRCAA